MAGSFSDPKLDYSVFSTYIYIYISVFTLSSIYMYIGDIEKAFSAQLLSQKASEEQIKRRITSIYSKT